jgi:hypothetical protein
MEHEIYPSIDAMLAPESLSALESRAVTDVRCLPFESVDSLSGSRFLIVETNHGPKSRYVAKWLSAEWDWIMRPTSDQYGRAVVAWQIGLLDRRPPEIDHAAVACADDGSGWAILMRDVGPDLIPPGDGPIGVRENTCFLTDGRPARDLLGGSRGS